MAGIATERAEAYTDIQVEATEWLEQLSTEKSLTVGSKYEKDAVLVAKLKKWKKDELVQHLAIALSYMEGLSCGLGLIIGQNLENQAPITCTHKKKVLNNLARIIALQEELLLSKTEQIKTLQSTVRTSVQDTVKAEFVSYSAALVKDMPPSHPPAMTADALRSVVKNVVEEEDRSRSVMLFGLPEESDKLLNDQISKVFEEVGLKPRFEANRLGNLGKYKKARPVKVHVSNSAVVNTILLRARNLKGSEQHGSVFICPDRSPGQRNQHRQLVTELKEKHANEPGRRHFIRSGKVCSAPKEVTQD